MKVGEETTLAYGAASSRSPDAPQARHAQLRFFFGRGFASSGDLEIAAPYANVLLALLASWPILRWFVARLGDGGDERFGLIALALAVVFTPRTLWLERVAGWRLLSAGALVLLSALPFTSMPMLVRALLMVTALAFLFCRGAGALGRAGLLALALPVTATLQFFAGYPLRVITAELGRPLIALFGVATERVGVALQWSGGVVVVDAPCSGVHMLWTGGVLACALAAWLRLGALRTLVLGVTGLGAILLGNIVRAATLFFIESGLWNAPHWAHEGVGLAIFATLAAGVLWLAMKLRNTSNASSTANASNGHCHVLSDNEHIRISLEKNAHCHLIRDNGLWRKLEKNIQNRGLRWRKRGVVFVMLCAIAAVMPLLDVREKNTVAVADFPGWPEMFEGSPWIRLRKPEAAAAFASGFAGETGVFRQGSESGGRIVVLRWIREASRGVHPAADCFRASGYGITQGGLTRDANGVLWREFFAMRSDETWRVRERWRDGGGGAWTDVSAWYWAAVRGGGPWWAVTVAERCDG